MVTEKETVKCEAIFSEDRCHRIFWKKVWDKNKPLACVIMLNPCSANCLTYDTTTYLVVNNVARLDKYGGVEILNIYSKLTNKLNLLRDSDEELNHGDNDTYIKKAAAECDIVILAWGTGAITNKRVLARVKDVLAMLKPFTKKLHVITDSKGLRAVHPLLPTARASWILEAFKSSDVEPNVKSKVVKSKTVPVTKNDNTLLSDVSVSDANDATDEEA